MKPYFITITRQFGSLGRPIARELAEILKIEYYDRDILEMASKEINKPVEELESYDETTKGIFNRMMYPLGIGDSSMHTRLFQMQKSIIKDIVSKGKSCIFVGRCADAILKDEERCLNIYIFAPYEQRLKNSIEVLGLSQEEAKRMIKEVDKAREEYHRTYAKKSPQSLDNKGLLINSSLLGVEGTGELLAEVVRKKFQ